MYKQLAGRLFLTLSLLAVCRFGTAATPPPPPAGSGVTLADCYQKALQVSESLAISEQEIAQLEAIYQQGVGKVLPYISWNMTQLWQDTSGTGGGTSSAGDPIRRRTPTSYFLLKQPLFHGLRDFNAVRGYKSAIKGARLNREQAALNLLADVAQVFYTALDLQHELEALSSQRQLTADRLAELERRVRLGRSRDSEVLSAQVELASLEAQIEETRQRWSVARQTLLFLTEVPATAPLVDNQPAPSLPALEMAQDKALSRPDLLAAGYTQEQERFRVRYAQGNFFPGLDVTGKYYTERVGFYEPVDWDVLLSLEVPLFAGFGTRGGVREARARQIAADLATARLKRQIRQEVQNAHDALRYSASQSQFYAKAVELAQQNYKVQLDEYRLGLINNLQVLQVLTDLQDLKIRQLRADASARTNAIQLRVAMGQGL